MYKKYILKVVCAFILLCLNVNALAQPSTTAYNNTSHFLMGFYGDNSNDYGNYDITTNAELGYQPSALNISRIYRADGELNFRRQVGSSVNTANVGNTSYYYIQNTSNVYQENTYLYTIITTSATSPIYQFNYLQMGRAVNNPNITYSSQLRLYEGNTLLGNISNDQLINGNVTTDFTPLTTAPKLQPGKTYQLRWYIREDLAAYSNMAVDNPQVYAYIIPNVTQTNLNTSCGTTTVTRAQLNSTVSSTTPANYQLRWFKGATLVNNDSNTAGIYTPYYYDTTSPGTGYHPAGTSVTVTASNTSTTITSPPNPATQTVNINMTPAIITITATGSGTLTYNWYKSTDGTTNTGTLVQSGTGNTFAPPTRSTAGTDYYYVTISGTCQNVTSNVVNVVFESSICSKPGIGGTSSDSYVGILNKASITVNNWPKAVPNGYIVLDSASKGFVITHIETTSQLSNLTPIIGMMVYDKEAKCVKIFRGNSPTINPSHKGWVCIEKGCNE